MRKKTVYTDHEEVHTFLRCSLRDIRAGKYKKYLGRDEGYAFAYSKTQEWGNIYEMLICQLHSLYQESCESTDGNCMVFGHE